MASFDDLGRALRDDAAANAPRASAIDVDAVTAAARARRRPRQWAVGALSVVAALGVGGLAIAAVTPPVLIAASESTDLDAGAEESSTAPLADEGGDGLRAERIAVADLVACGALAASPAMNDVGLELELPLETRAPSEDSSLASVTALVNTAADPITVVTGTTPVAVLTQNNEVVGREVPRDNASLEFTLAPGESRQLPVVISTVDCRGTGVNTLPPGRYGIAAALDVLDPTTGEWILVIARSVELELD